MIAASTVTKLGAEVLAAAHDHLDLAGIVTRDAIAPHVQTPPQGVSRALGRLRELGLVDDVDERQWVITREGFQVLDELRGSRRCRSCGCTDHVACDDGCWWVEHDLCSSCVAEQVAA